MNRISTPFRFLFFGLAFLACTGTLFANGTEKKPPVQSGKPQPQRTKQGIIQAAQGERLDARAGTVGESALNSPVRVVPFLNYPFTNPAIQSGDEALDPIRFTLHANVDSLVFDKELTITIKAEVLNIPPSAAFTFDESYRFRLKVLMPEGFVQTGGDYSDYVYGQLDRWQPGQSVQFTLKGRFQARPENPCFVLLRGAHNADDLSRFVRRAELCLKVPKGEAISNADTRAKTAREAAIASDPSITTVTHDCKAGTMTVVAINSVGYTIRLYQNGLLIATQAVPASGIVYFSGLANGSFYWVSVWTAQANCTGGPYSHLNPTTSAARQHAGNASSSVAQVQSASPCEYFYGPLINWDTTPDFQLTNNYSCNGTTYQRQEVDQNSCSSTSPDQRSRWVDVEINSCKCRPICDCADKTPNWQNTDTYRCDEAKTFQRLQRNTNACSSPADSTRWVDIESNSCNCRNREQNWQNTAITTCKGDTLKRQQQNINECSNEPFATRWVVEDPCGCNNRQPDWQYTGATRCNFDAFEREVRNENRCTNNFRETRWIIDNACGCYTVKPIVGGNDQSCGGNELSVIGVSNYGSVRWYRDGGAIGGNGSTLWADAPGTYTVQVFSPGGCPSQVSDGRYINAKPNPTVGAWSNSGNGEVRAEETLQLNSSPSSGASVTWNGPNGFSRSEVNPSISNVTQAATGTYTVTANLNGCTAQASTYVNVSPPLPRLYQGVLDQAHCGGVSGWIIDRNRPNQSNQVNIFVDGSLRATIEANGSRADIRDIYFPGNGYTSYGFSWPLPDDVKTGRHTVHVTYPNGGEFGRRDYGVELTGSGSNSPSGQRIVGDELTLWSTATDGAAYQWSGPNGFSSNQQNPSIPNVTTAANGTYTVTASLNGCSVQGNTSVSISAPALFSPIITADKTELCPNEGTNLRAIGCPADGTVNWSNGLTGTSIPIQPASNTNYTATCTVRGSTGAPSNQLTVMVVTRPTNVTAQASKTTYVEGESIALMAAATGATTYAWTGQANFMASVQNPNRPSATQAMSGLYTVTASNSFGCTATASTTVTVVGAGSPCGQVVTKIRFMPRLDCPVCMSRFAGGYFEASNDSTQWTLLASITAQPAADWNDYTVSSPTAWRYVRYVASSNSYGEAAEIEFYSGSTKLTGRIFSSGSLGVAYLPEFAFDGMTNTFWHGTEPRFPVPQNVIGLNIQKNIITATGSNSPNGQVAVGGTLNLTASALSGATFSWSGPNGFSSTQQNPSIANAQQAASGIYTVTANNGSGCTATASTTVAIGAAASPCGQVVTKIRFMPRLDCPVCMSRFAGGYFEASNDSTQWTLLASITAQPAADWNEYTVSSPTAWRYVRYVASSNSYGEAAEIEFWSGSTKLTGRIFSSGSLGAAYLPEFAFDGLSNTFWHGTEPRFPVPQNFIGLNIQKTIITSIASNSPNGQMAVGGTLALSATATGATGYAWSGPNGFTSTQQNPSLANATQAATGTYTVTVSGAGGCSLQASVAVRLRAACLLRIDSVRTACNPTAPDSLRKGTLTAFAGNRPTGGQLFYRIQQTSGGSFATTQTENGTFTGLTDGTYTVSAWHVTGPDTCRAATATAVVRCGPVALCNLRIKATDSTGTETDVLPRLGGTLRALNLAVENFEGQPLAGGTLRWVKPDGSFASTATLTAGVIGEYQAQYVKGLDTCVATLTLRAKPCKAVAHTYNCGTAPATPLPDGGSPRLSHLAPGDTVRTGDFDVVVTEVQGGNAQGWQGRGYTEIPYLKGTKIAVELKGAIINECYELVGGIVLSVYDPAKREVVEVNLENNLDYIQQIISDIKSDFTGSTANIQKLALLNQKINELKEAANNSIELTGVAKQKLIDQLQILDSLRDMLQDNPCLCNCSGGNASNGRMSYITDVGNQCPIDKLLAATGESKDILNSPNSKTCHPTYRFEKEFAEFEEGEFNWDQFTLGNWSHTMIQSRYKLDHQLQTVHLEWAIPNSGSSGNTYGYADIVNADTGEIFEIKPVEKAQNGPIQLERYVKNANASCNPNPSPIITYWKRGINGFRRGESNAEEIFCPLYRTEKKLRYWLDETKDGLVLYRIVDNVNPRVVPSPITYPSTIPDDIRKRLRQVLLEVSRNPDPEYARQRVRWLLAAVSTPVLYTILATGVIGEVAAIAEEIVTLGGATPAVAVQALVCTTFIVVSWEIINSR